MVSNLGYELSPTAKDGDGFILKCNSLGIPQQVFAPQIKLNAPKGMKVHQGILFLTDVDRFLAIDLTTQELVKNWDLSSTGGLFFNDPEWVGDRFWISATDLNTIYSIHPDSSRIQKIEFKQPFFGPNGLAYDSNSQVVYVAEWGTGEPNGRLLKIYLNQDNAIEILGDFTGHLDGLQMDEASNCVFSDWNSGKIFRHQDGKSTAITDSLGGPADFILSRKHLIIPCMMENQIMIR